MTGLISSEKAVLMDNRTVDPEEFLKKIDGVDLILTEGFKHGPWPKIMLHRKETGKPMWRTVKMCSRWTMLGKRRFFYFSIYSRICNI